MLVGWVLPDCAEVVEPSLGRLAGGNREYASAAQLRSAMDDVKERGFIERSFSLGIAKLTLNEGRSRPERTKEKERHKDVSYL